MFKLLSVSKTLCFQIGLDRRASEDTRLFYVTTGVLLQMLVKKQSLGDYTHIILDEIHERDSETDFLLIILRKFLKEMNCRAKVSLCSYLYFAEINC